MLSILFSLVPSFIMISAFALASKASKNINKGLTYFYKASKYALKHSKTYFSSTHTSPAPTSSSTTSAPASTASAQAHLSSPKPASTLRYWRDQFLWTFRKEIPPSLLPIGEPQATTSEYDDIAQGPSRWRWFTEKIGMAPAEGGLPTFELQSWNHHHNEENTNNRSQGSAANRFTILLGRWSTAVSNLYLPRDAQSLPVAEPRPVGYAASEATPSTWHQVTHHVKRIFNESSESLTQYVRAVSGSRTTSHSSTVVTPAQPLSHKPTCEYYGASDQFNREISANPYKATHECFLPEGVAAKYPLINQETRLEDACDLQFEGYDYPELHAPPHTDCQPPSMLESVPVNPTDTKTTPCAQTKSVPVTRIQPATKIQTQPATQSETRTQPNRLPGSDFSPSSQSPTAPKTQTQDESVLLLTPQHTPPSILPKTPDQSPFTGPFAYTLRSKEHPPPAIQPFGVRNDIPRRTQTPVMLAKGIIGAELLGEELPPLKLAYTSPYAAQPSERVRSNWPKFGILQWFRGPPTEASSV